VGSIPTPGIARLERGRAVNAPAMVFNLASVLWVALGGALGSVGRFAIGELLRRPPGPPQFPWGTFTVNITGAVALGWVFGWALDSALAPQYRAFLMIGVLGGFTTFSSFSFETLSLIQSGQSAKALLYVVLSVALSVGGTALGYGLART
jgi:CrcB protein